MSFIIRLPSLSILSLSVLLAFTPFAQADEHTALPDVHVTAERTYSGADLWMGSIDKIDQESIDTVRAVSLGQTLEKQAGVQNQNMGPNNGLPQIRSLSGNRVLLMEDGTAISDLSAISPNLAVPTESFLARQIDVYKSAASVLYGGRALGGAVDVHTGRIPTTLPEKSFSGQADLGIGINAPDSGMFAFDGKINEHIAWHLDGGMRKISSYRIKGSPKADLCYDKLTAGLNTELTWLCQTRVRVGNWVINKAYWPYVDGRYYSKKQEPGFIANKDYVPGTKNPYLPDLDETTVKDIVPVSPGRIPNSHFESKTLSGGISYIGDKGYIGIGVNRYLTDYGIPGFASLRTEAGDREIGMLPANVRADTTRMTLQGEYRPETAWIKSLQLRLNNEDSDNSEYLGDVFAGSLNGKTRQARVEMHHATGETVALEGVVGADWKRRDTTGDGPDRYLDDTRSNDYALFALQQARFKGLTAGVGYRYGKAKRHLYHTDGYEPSRGQGQGEQIPRRDFPLHDYQASLKWQPLANWMIQAQYTHAERAPDVNELYSNNRHFAILTNEHGDSKLDKETARSWEFSSRFDWKNFTLKATHYRTRLHNYIYLGYTGVERYDMPYKEWKQGDTEISGWEAELAYRLDGGQFGVWDFRAFLDKVKNAPVQNSDNEFHITSDGDSMPGLPVSRYGIGIDWYKNRWQVSTSVTHYQNPTRLGKLVNPEKPLGSYTLWDMRIAKTHHWRNMEVQWYADARNLTNAKARAHQSPLKYLTPLPGRSLTAGVKVNF